MNLTKTLQKKYNPEVAVIVYRSNDNDYYLESHKFENTKGRNTLTAGVPLTEDTISSIVEYFKDKEGRESILKGETPPTLLFTHWSAERRVLAWYNPPMERHMSFTKSLAIPNGKASQPGLVYVIENGSLNLYAYSTEGRPQTNNTLFCAPYHNVSASGSVCLGSARVNKPKEKSFTAIINYYETLFWASEFSHLAGSQNPINGNLNTFWKLNIKQKRPFDISVLKQGDKKITLETLIKRLSR